MTQRVNIKGIREGLLITVEAQSGTAAGDDGWLAALQTDLAAKSDFLRGSRVTLNVGNRSMNRRQIEAVQTVMTDNGLELWAVLTEARGTREAARELGLATRLAGSNTDLDGNMLATADSATNVMAVESMAGTPGLFLKETLRSGRRIFHEGHIAVIGDVNAGAEIVAAGDVIVWGKLRGLVHAGAMGEATAVICALELTPTQLRIADQIAIAPEDRRSRPSPEMAAIRGGRIVAETWSMADKGTR
jgi:septum site-determining protein MinC